MLHFAIAAMTAAAATLTPAPAATYACQVKYEFVSTWNTGYQANIDITNTGDAILYGWTLKFALPAGQSLAQGWNADWSATTAGLQAVSLTGVNDEVPPKGSAHPQYLGRGAPPFAEPKEYFVNEIRCSVI